jgi:hypothetical protein
MERGFKELSPCFIYKYTDIPAILICLCKLIIITRLCQFEFPVIKKTSGKNPEVYA